MAQPFSAPRMFFTFFKTAFRNLLRNRRHAMLNIAGLGLALAACLIVFLVLEFEYSHNRHLKNYDRLSQVVTRDKDSEGEHFTGGVPFPMIQHLRLDFPEQKFGQFMQNYGTQVTVRNPRRLMPEGNKFIESTGVFYADPELAELFEIKFLLGSAADLKGVQAVALSRKTAERYFGDWKDAAGNFINFDNAKTDLKVMAIFEDLPDNCDFPFQILASYTGFEANSNGWPLTDWGSNTSNHQVFTLLPPTADVSKINTQLAGFERKHNTDNKNTTRVHFLHPMAQVHFDPRFPTTGDHQITPSALYTLASIGLLILLMACINYVNLSTALAVTRSKEVGVRKVLGGTRSQVRLQVFAETLLLVGLAMSLGMVIAWLALPYVKTVMVVQSPLHLFTPLSLLYILLITLFTTALAGLYPAFVMGSFRPVEAIKNKISTGKVGSISLRRVLVVVQFSFSQIFIIATIIAVSQMEFIRNADLGFQKDAVLLLHGSAENKNLAAFKNELLTRTDVKSVTLCFDAPSSDNSWQTNFAFDNTEDRDFSVATKFGDEDYLKTFGMKLVAGRMYAKTDTVREFLVNETFLKKVGVKDPQQAIGKMVRLGGQPFRPICGVVADFVPQSLKSEIAPVVLFTNKKYSGMTAVKLSGSNLGRSKDEIRKIWDKYFPDNVFHEEFLDESIESFYANEKRISTMYKVYAVLAIFISCLGLYGLISYMVVQKTKEVGIRKILGASVQSLVYLFSKEFTFLILIAFLLAGPTAWYFMNIWLEEFAYRVEIGPGVFLIAILVSGLIAGITVGYKSLQAARANPIKSLRTE
ncbi:MAG TPA: ABC transporter permease [Catalimonadaceae bacterium]|nr:ABC transporter permease [Catalimonadaceae bacterium]